jgi:hypothetical protein
MEKRGESMSTQEEKQDDISSRHKSVKNLENIKSKGSLKPKWPKN